MDFLLLVFCVAIVAFVRPRCGSSTGEGAQSYLSIENTNALRGIMAIAIVLHHLSEHVNSGRFFHVLNHAGYLLVAVFFFLSGYGLMVSFQRKGKAYLEGFWKKRILYFAIILLLDTLLYVAFNYLYGKECTISSFLLSFVNGHPLAGSSWYLITLIYFYIFFWGVFMWCDSPKRRMILMFLLVSLCDILFLLLDYPTYWCFSNLSFVVGLLWAAYQEDIDLHLGKHYWPVLLATALLFMFFSLLPKIAGGGYLLCRIISSPLFAVLIVLLLVKIKLVGKLWGSANIISLEIFLLHALVYRFFRSNIVYVQNDVVWVCLTIACTVLLAIPAHLLNRKIRSYL